MKERVSGIMEDKDDINSRKKRRRSIMIYHFFLNGSTNQRPLPNNNSARMTCLQSFPRIGSENR